MASKNTQLLQKIAEQEKNYEGQIISMIRPSAFTNMSGYMAAWWQLHRKMVAADLCDMDLAIRVTEVHEITSKPLFR